MKSYYWLVLILLICFVARLLLALDTQGFFGVDGGPMLLSRNYVLGWYSNIIGPGLPKPPLDPGWLIVPFTQLLGDDIGFKVYSVLFSLLTIPAVYLLARRYLTQGLALLCAFFIAFDVHMNTMFVTGVQPLIGMSLLLVCMWAIAELREHKSWIPQIALILSIPLIAYTNQTSVMLGMVYLSIWICVLLLNTQQKRQFITAIGIPILAGVAIASTALPWYIPQLPGSERTHWPGPWLFILGWADTAWLQLAMSAFIAWRLWIIRAVELKALACVIMVAAILAPFMSYDETLINLFFRSRYFLMLPLTIGIFVWVQYSRWHITNKVMFPLVTAGFALLMIVGSIYIVRAQAQNSMMLSYDADEAMEYAKPSDTIITSAYSMAAWVTAVHKVHTAWTVTGEPPQDQYQQYEHVRCVLGWYEDCDVHRAVVALQASHVLIDERMPFVTESAIKLNWLAPEDQWQVTASAPWLELIFSKGTVRLYKIKPEVALGIAYTN